MSNDQSQGTIANSGEKSPGFFKRYRLALTLAVIAVCLYAGSILYIMYGKGQIS